MFLPSRARLSRDVVAWLFFVAVARRFALFAKLLGLSSFPAPLAFRGWHFCRIARASASVAKALRTKVSRSFSWLALSLGRVKRRREVSCRIRNHHRSPNRLSRSHRRHLHARAQLKWRHRAVQSIIWPVLRALAHCGLCATALRRVRTIHLRCGHVTPAAARHRALLRRACIPSRHERERHRQQRHNQCRRLYPPHRHQS